MIGWGVVYGVVFGALLVAAIPLLPSLFSAAPDVRRMLPAVLLVAAAQQPVAGVVFVLDGVLIGAGDQDYLALAGLARLSSRSARCWSSRSTRAWSPCGWQSACG
jgi:Na+-driven multidrug efflux pump